MIFKKSLIRKSNFEKNNVEKKICSAILEFEDLYYSNKYGTINIKKHDAELSSRNKVVGA